MNARVDPAALAPAACGGDVDLIEACRAALRGMGSYRKAKEAATKLIAKWERSTASFAVREKMQAKANEADRIAHAVFLDLTQHLDALSQKPPTTMYGAAWKASVVHMWLALGGDASSGVGCRIIASLLHDVCLLGTAGNNDGEIKLVDRKAA